MIQLLVGFALDRSLDDVLIAARPEPFRSICEMNSEGLAARFLELAFPDPNTPFPNGDRPLHVAVLYGCVGVVRHLLLTCGADSAARDGHGCSSVHLATKAGRLEVADLLLRCGADVNSFNFDGETSLHQCSLTGLEVPCSIS